MLEIKLEPTSSHHCHGSWTSTKFHHHCIAGTTLCYYEITVVTKEAEMQCPAAWLLSVFYFENWVPVWESNTYSNRDSFRRNNIRFKNLFSELLLHRSGPFHKDFVKNIFIHKNWLDWNCLRIVSRLLCLCLNVICICLWLFVCLYLCYCHRQLI